MMPQRIVATAVLGIAIFAGIATGWRLADGNDPPAPQDEVNSITGVSSGSRGSNADDPPPEGVEQIPPSEPPPLEPEISTNQVIDLKGVPGADGTEARPAAEDAPPAIDVPNNAIQGVNAEQGIFQSIRGIEGIDSVPLQNLEAVLRMQQPPPETPPQGGGARAAARLLTMEPQETTELQPIEDGREEMTDIELEGS
jgi:hypothetical protein